jgi:carbon monoxide dehydrogenase subunit G
MTVRAERSFELPYAPEAVWEFIADPRKRAAAISVVEEHEVDGDRGSWQVRLPLPIVDSTVTVQTRDEQLRAPEYVRFTGRSKVMHVVGEHELEDIDGGTRLTNRFVVDGKLPGVERFFRRNLDDEMDDLYHELLDSLETIP